MKLFRFGIRLWITVTSILAFLSGWILLAHAPKPSQSQPSSSGLPAPLPTLAPLQLSDDNANLAANNLTSGSFFNSRPQDTFHSRPFFSTGGS